MGTTRRDFIKAAAMGAVATAASGPGFARGIGPQDSLQWVKTVCRFCGTGCGVRVAVRDDLRPPHRT